MSSGVVGEEELIALAALAGVGGVLSAYGVRVMRLGRIVSSRLDTVHGTPLLGRYPIEAFHWAARALGRALSRTGVTPDTLTWVSLAISFFAFPLAARGRFELAGAALLVGSAFDALDGIVARERRMASEAGGILDSVLDRYADACALVGMAVFYGASEWRLSVVLLALVGQMMVSYVRAKAEGFGLALESGLMRRPERIAYLAAGLILGPTASQWLMPDDPNRSGTLAVVGLIAVVSNAAALRLLADARVQLRRRAERDAP